MLSVFNSFVTAADPQACPGYIMRMDGRHVVMKSLLECLLAGAGLVQVSTVQLVAC